MALRKAIQIYILITSHVHYITLLQFTVLGIILKLVSIMVIIKVLQQQTLKMGLALKIIIHQVVLFIIMIIIALFAPSE